jgi:hypothetical protein
MKAKLGLGILLATVTVGAAVLSHSYTCQKVATRILPKHKHLSRQRVDEILAWNKAHPNWHPRHPARLAYKITCDELGYLHDDMPLLPDTSDFHDDMPLIPSDDQGTLLSLTLPSYLPPEVSLPTDPGPELSYVPVLTVGPSAPLTPSTPAPEPSSVSLVLLGIVMSKALKVFYDQP